MGITLKEIAKMANVHRSTVDKVIHNRYGVSDEVREKIQKILHETGYKPNSYGQALQKHSSVIRIAVLLLKTDATDIIKTGIESSLKENESFNIQLSCYLTEYSHPSEQKIILEKLIEERVDGIIINPFDNNEVCEAVNMAVDAGIKVVATNFDIEEGRHLCYIGQNFIKAGAIAASMMGLFLGGEGNVALITVTEPRSDTSFFEGRRTGFVNQLEREFPNIKIIDSVAGYDDSVIIERETRKLLDKQASINGIFITGGGVEVIGKLLKEYGVANQVRVICFERYSGILELIREGVVNCTIDSDLISQGRKPLEVLLDAIVYNKTPESRYMYTKEDLLFRGSIE